MPTLVGNIKFIACEVTDHLIHTVHADCGEMVIKRWQPSARERIQTFIDKGGDGCAAAFQRLHPERNETIQLSKQPCLIITVLIAQASHIHRDDSD
ncbi:Uncharacterised protein [Chlamydia trachomatis]|nr:Uncharacterised protein [Chlamydia trachomatis]